MISWDSVAYLLSLSDAYDIWDNVSILFFGKNGVDCYSKNGHAVTVLTRQS